MKNHLAAVLLLFLLLPAFGLDAVGAEEIYIITVGNGSQLVVKEYHFTGDEVRFTTPGGKQGSIGKEDFVSIANMIGVPPEQEAQDLAVERQKEREVLLWLAAAAVILMLYVCYLVYVSRSGGGHAGADTHYGRVEMEPTTQGHLSFTYRPPFWRRHDWTIDVRRAYEEDDILFIEGICVATGKRKLFRADRVVGEALDRSSECRAAMRNFFVDAEERRRRRS